MRRPPQLGQKPRPLHENATRRSVQHRVQRRRAKPPASAATEKLAELLLHEAGQPLAVAQVCGVWAEGLKVVAHDVIQRAGGGIARPVGVGRPGHARR
jgi:hypothetical protein